MPQDAERKAFFRVRLNHTAKLLLPVIQRVPFFKHDLFLCFLQNTYYYISCGHTTDFLPR